MNGEAINFTENYDNYSGLENNTDIKSISMQENPLFQIVNNENGLELNDSEDQDLTIIWRLDNISDQLIVNRNRCRSCLTQFLQQQEYQKLISEVCSLERVYLYLQELSVHDLIRYLLETKAKYNDKEVTETRTTSWFSFLSSSNSNEDVVDTPKHRLESYLTWLIRNSVALSKGVSRELFLSTASQEPIHSLVQKDAYRVFQFVDSLG